MKTKNIIKWLGVLCAGFFLATSSVQAAGVVVKAVPAKKTKSSVQKKIAAYRVLGQTVDQALEVLDILQNHFSDEIDEQTVLDEIADDYELLTASIEDRLSDIKIGFPNIPDFQPPVYNADCGTERAGCYAQSAELLARCSDNYEYDAGEQATSSAITTAQHPRGCIENYARRQSNCDQTYHDCKENMAVIDYMFRLGFDPTSMIPAYLQNILDMLGDLKHEIELDMEVFGSVQIETVNNFLSIVDSMIDPVVPAGL